MFFHSQISWIFEDLNAFLQKIKSVLTFVLFRGSKRTSDNHKIFEHRETEAKRWIDYLWAFSHWRIDINIVIRLNPAHAHYQTRQKWIKKFFIFSEAICSRTFQSKIRLFQKRDEEQFEIEKNIVRFQIIIFRRPAWENKYRLVINSIQLHSEANTVCSENT